MDVFIKVTCVMLLLSVKTSAQDNKKLAPYFVKTTSMNCYGNPELIVNVSCRLKPINWVKTIANMDSDLVGVIRNASVHSQLFKYTNQFRPYLVNMTTNICDIMKTGRGNAYVKAAVKVLLNFTNVNHPCPFSGHLAARGIYLDASIMPFFVPSGKYKVVAKFYEGWPYVHIGTVEVVGMVTENNRFNRNGSRKFSPK